MNEAELLKAFRRDRSEAAFAELIRRYAALVFSTAKRRVDNASLAEDVTQVVFIRFAKTPPDVKTAGELAAWLHRTTVNVAIDAWRSETRRRNRELQAVTMEFTTSATWEEICPMLDQAVNQLNDEDRQAILLRFFGRKTMRDVGAALGVSEAAAKMRIGRAVERLRGQLGASGIACSAGLLGVALAEHSTQAAPMHLVSQLAAMRLPALAAGVGKGGLVHSLAQVSRLKIGASAALVASLGLLFMHFTRSPNAARPVRPPQTPSSATRNGMTAFNRTSSIDSPLKAPKILLHVLDAETGRGIAGAQIQFVYVGPGYERENHETFTDENGDATLQSPDDPEKDSAPNVYLRADGYVPQFISPTNNECTTRLDAAMTIGGFIVDTLGAPVPGVAIYFQYIQGMDVRSGNFDNVDFPNSPVYSHEDGGWACSHVPKNFTNDIHLILKKPGYATALRIVSPPYHSTFRNHIDLTRLVLMMDTGAFVTGKVTDEQDRPIAGAQVRIVARNFSERQTAQTDGGGVFTLDGVAGDGSDGSLYQPLQTNGAGTVLLIKRLDVDDLQKRMPGVLLPSWPAAANIAVQADGFASEMKTIKPLAATNFISFKLAPGNIFRGHVLDDLGNPITNAVVQTDYSPGQEQKFKWMTHTDTNGEFLWDSAPAEGTKYRVDAEGYQSVYFLSSLADGTEHEVRLERKAAD